MQPLAEGCPAHSTSTRPRALQSGGLCTDGTSMRPTDRSGDVVAGYQKLRHGVGTHLRTAFISRWTDARCLLATDGLAVHICATSATRK